MFALQFETRLPGNGHNRNIQGISTRSLDDLVKAMGLGGISRSQVARLCAELDERVHAFLNRLDPAGGKNLHHLRGHYQAIIGRHFPSELFQKIWDS